MKARVRLIRASENNKYPKIAPDFGSSTRRADCFILVVWGHWRHAVDGPKDMQDGIIHFFRGPNSGQLMDMYYER